jgi:hypothetical protein
MKTSIAPNLSMCFLLNVSITSTLRHERRERKAPWEIAGRVGVFLAGIDSIPGNEESDKAISHHIFGWFDQLNSVEFEEVQATVGRREYNDETQE